MLCVQVFILFSLKLIIVGGKWTSANNMLSESVDVDKHLFQSAWEGPLVFYQKFIVITNPHLPDQVGQIYSLPSTAGWATFSKEAAVLLGRI